MPGIHFREVVCMLGIFGLFLQAAAGHILYLALHLESGSFPRPLPPDRERAAFADLQKGGAAAAQARDTLIRHNLRLVAHICKKYYAGNSAQDDMISIGTIGLIKAVDTFDPAKGKRFASYASRCIENELRMDLRRGRRTGVTLSLQEPLEADGQLTLADTLPDEADMEAGCESRADAARLRALVDALPARERAIMRQRYGFDGAPKTQQQTAQALHISRSCFAAGKARTRVPARPVAGGMTGTARRECNQLKNDGGGDTKYHLRQKCGMMRQNAPHICHTFVNCRIYDINREMHEAAR